MRMVSTAYRRYNSGARFKQLSEPKCSMRVVQKRINILFEEVPVDFKLLFKHDLSPIFNDKCVWFQVLGCSEDLSVFLNSCYPTQLELQRENICFMYKKMVTLLILYSDMTKMVIHFLKIITEKLATKTVVELSTRWFRLTQKVKKNKNYF